MNASPDDPISSDPDARPAALPSPRVSKSRWPFPIIWIVPIIAALAAGYYVYSIYRQRGVEISITFDDANGLKLRDTPLNYHGVRVGSVSRIELDDERGRALVVVRLERAYQDSIARDGGKFWLVRPDLGGGMITGLTTVISGPYIDCVPGAGSPVFKFYGLDSRPVLLGDGLRVVLHTDRLAHVQIDSPVYFRGLQVGAVQDIRFAGDATEVNVTAFIWERYAKLLRRGSRFWYVSGTDIKGGVFSGISLEVNNLKALISGGVAFATSDESAPDRVPDGTNFTLHEAADKDWLKWTAKIALPLDQNPGQVTAPPP